MPFQKTEPINEKNYRRGSYHVAKSLESGQKFSFRFLCKERIERKSLIPHLLKRELESLANSTPFAISVYGKKYHPVICKTVAHRPRLQRFSEKLVDQG